MKKIVNILMVTVLFIGSAAALKAQESSKNDSLNYNKDSTIQVIITLKDQSTIKGVIIKMDLNEVILKTEFAGIVNIKQANIVSIVNLKYVDTQIKQYPKIYNPNNPNDLDIVKFGGSTTNYSNQPYKAYSMTHRYNFSNNYIGLKKNEVIFNNIWLLYNGADFGLTDNLSLGGGILFLGYLGFLNVLGRGQIKINQNIKIGASYNYFVLFDMSGYNNDNNNNFGLLTGGITFMGKKGNISFSLANGYYDKSGYGQNRTENIPIFSISGCYDLNDKTSVISDNFFITQKTNPRFYSLGLRIKGRTGNFDFGVMGYIYDETYSSYYSSNSTTTDTRTIPIPYLAYTQIIK